ncbi:MAG: alpha/beta hydrolase, partial [Bdellovibrionales bacterium]|nr:alpha/beta hydrolase [Bdellovibrionales bacterium]
DHYNFLELAHYIKNNNKLFLLHNRGMGLSSKVEKPYTIEDMALDAVRVMDKFGYSQFHVCGISMGGVIAQCIASQFPEKVLSLSLLCSPGVGPEFPKTIPLSEDQIRQSYGENVEASISRTVELLTHEQADEKVKQKIIQIRKEHLPQVDQVVLQNNAICEFLSEGKIEYEKIQCPTLLLTGDQDVMVSAENSKILNSKIKYSHKEVIPRSNHLFFMEKPIDVGAYLSDFLDLVNKEL